MQIKIVCTNNIPIIATDSITAAGTDGNLSNLKTIDNICSMFAIANEPVRIEMLSDIKSFFIHHAHPNT